MELLADLDVHTMTAAKAVGGAGGGGGGGGVVGVSGSGGGQAANPVMAGPTSATAVPGEDRGDGEDEVMPTFLVSLFGSDRNPIQTETNTSTTLVCLWLEPMRELGSTRYQVFGGGKYDRCVKERVGYQV